MAAEGRFRDGIWQLGPGPVRGSGLVARRGRQAHQVSRSVRVSRSEIQWTRDELCGRHHRKGPRARAECDGPLVV